MDEYIVEMKHITKRFPGIVANDDISLSIKKGEIFALLGENGAGKSTLMSILFGMYQPDEGEIFIRGEKVVLNSAKEAAALNIGMVHQHFKLVSNYTITENIVLGVEPIRKIAGLLPYVDLSEANEKVRTLSESYGLNVNPEQRIEDVDVSTQQRVEILKILYREAEILIFDEPTAVLTPQEIEYLLKIIRELQKGGKTIILITHKLEEIKHIADRCAVLRRGKLVDIRDTSAMSTEEMAYLMVGREMDFNLNKAKSNFGDVVLDVQGLYVQNENKFNAVKNVSFQVRRGEIFAVAGVSGNGQTELAHAIAGLMMPSSGTIRLKGEDITDEPIRKRTEAGVSYIPEDRQKYGLVLDYKLQENLAIKTYHTEPFSKRGLLRQEGFRAYAEKLIEEYDIRSGQGSGTLTRSMSGGNQQKTIVAREISLDSDLMIFMQPTRGLDIGAIDNIHRNILRERGNGRAVLLISLELDEVMLLADTIGVIYNGELLKIANAQSFTEYELGKYMMGVTE